MINDEALDALFRTARTHNGWTADPVTDDDIKRIYELAKMGPTSANSNPLRAVFVRSPEAKARLKPALSPGNLDKTMAAPATAIFAFDLEFYKLMPRLFPVAPHFGDMFAQNPAKAEGAARLNATLSAGYFILAARALGIDCGPMGGFDNAKVDAEFFPDSPLRSLFLCNLGHGDPAKLYPRGPRLDFEEACKIL